MRKILTIIILILLIIPLSVQAFFLDDWFDDLFEHEFDLTSTNSVQIINEVRVEANTGGNKAEQGEIIEGKGEIRVEVRQIVNNEEIELIDIETEANEVKVESEIRVEDNEVDVKREIDIEGEAVEISTKSFSKIENVKNWFSSFVKNLKSIILGIFNI